MKWPALILALGFGFATAAGSHASPQRDVAMIEITGEITPTTAGYVSRAINLAAERNNSCLIVRLNTPGGVFDSTQRITEKFFASPVPIVVFVAPKGAMATSAGCYITMAADIAAMSPGTSIGAAHVVLSSGGKDELDDVMKKKLENVGVSYIELIARQRHRNVEWARSAASESVSITEEKALELNVIDLIANDLPDLLRQLDGREVHGKELKTAGATVVPIPMSWGENFFQMFWRPEVTFILLLIAIYGIIGEINHPGAIFPGVAGAIALILFLYLAMVLPINTAGVALVILAVALFIIDVYAPTHGVLTVGGIISFFLGALMLFNRADPAFRLPIGWIIGATAVTTLFFLFVVGAALRARRLPVRAGKETMFGKSVSAVAPINATTGKVFVEGEYWNAVSDAPVEAGQRVEIIGIDGLTLKVKRL
jgi:membrane-bound serine protease (ClpP class)